MKLFSKIKLSKYIKNTNFNMSNKLRNNRVFDIKKRKFSSYFINNMDQTNYLKNTTMTFLGLSGLALGYYLLNGPSNQAACVEATNNSVSGSAGERIDNETRAENRLEKAIDLFKEKRYREAMLYLLAAARYGSNLAQYQLAIHLLDGKYVHPDPEKALFWLNRSISRISNEGLKRSLNPEDEEPLDEYPEDIKAMFYIGLIHQAGFGGVKKDPVEALFWYSQAMDAGEERAVTEMGVILDNHIENKSDPEDMINVYENYYNANERGEKFAAFNMGKLSTMDIGSLQRNYKHAYDYFKDAAKKGLTPAMIEMSILLNRGLGVGKNNKLAEKQLVKAIKKGNVLAIYNLAFAYETGAFGVKDEKKALDLYREAYERGDTPSLYKLAVMSIQGRGCTADFSKGVRFLRIAASKGDENAKNYLNTLIQEKKI